MIINVKNGNDVITLDFRMNQIRYCRNLKKHGKIAYLNQSQSTMECFEYLHKEVPDKFLESLAEDVGNEIGKQIDPAKLQILTEQQYMEVVA